MAYIGQKEKKELAPAIKAVLKKFGMKGTIGIDNHRGLKVTLRAASAGVIPPSPYCELL